MTIGSFGVSDRGQMALSAEAYRRWNLSEGGTVEIADLGDGIVIVPANRGELRSMLNDAVVAAGGYAALVSNVVVEDPDLA